MAISPQNKTGAFLLLLAGMIIFGSGTPVSKLVTQDYPPMLASGLRMGLAALFLLPFALRKGSLLPSLTGKEWLSVFLVALVGNVFFSLLMLYGMKMVSGVTGSVIMSMTPAVTAIAAVLFLHEKINAMKITALVLSLAGVLVMNISSGTGGSSPSGYLFLGAFLVFGAVCCEACYTLLGKAVMKKLGDVHLAFLAALIAFILFLPLAFWQMQGFDWSKPSPYSWASLMWWGLGTMGLGSLLWYKGVKSVPGHIAAGFMAVMPVSALVLSYILLREPFRWIHLVGFGLTFAGVLLIVREHMNMARHKNTGH